jgi:glycosyltransferase involved in cell wall biosynthesis
MLTIAIPTWNRADHLKRCLQSIFTDEMAEFPVRVFVFDNASDDGTAEYLDALKEMYPDNFDYRVAPEHLDYAESFREAFTAPDTEWVWMMGDDDMIIPGGIAFVMDVIKSDRYQFFHVAEKSRCRGTSDIYSGTLLELANTMGLVEVTGFISGNICRSEYLKRGFASPHFGTYAESAFVQSLVLLEVLHDKHSAFIDMPVIDLQSDREEGETAKRWNRENIGMRYNRIAEGLCCLIGMNVLPSSLPAEFFRYLGGDLIGKMLHTFWVNVENTGKMPEDIEWSRLYDLVIMGPDSSQRLRSIEAYEAAMSYYLHSREEMNKELKNVAIKFNDCLPNRYPETYI